jgi:hypothetical protein
MRRRSSARGLNQPERKAVVSDHKTSLSPKSFSDFSLLAAAASRLLAFQRGRALRTILGAHIPAGCAFSAGTEGVNAFATILG